MTVNNQIKIQLPVIPLQPVYEIHHKVFEYSLLVPLDCRENFKHTLFTQLNTFQTPLEQLQNLDHLANSLINELMAGDEADAHSSWAALSPAMKFFKDSQLEWKAACGIDMCKLSSRLSHVSPHSFPEVTQQFRDLVCHFGDDAMKSQLYMHLPPVIEAFSLAPPRYRAAALIPFVLDKNLADLIESYANSDFFDFVTKHPQLIREIFKKTTKFPTDLILFFIDHLNQNENLTDENVTSFISFFTNCLQSTIYQNNDHHLAADTQTLNRIRHIIHSLQNNPNFLEKLRVYVSTEQSNCAAIKRNIRAAIERNISLSEIEFLQALSQVDTLQQLAEFLIATKRAELIDTWALITNSLKNLQEKNTSHYLKSLEYLLLIRSKVPSSFKSYQIRHEPFVHLFSRNKMRNLDHLTIALFIKNALAKKLQFPTSLCPDAIDPLYLNKINLSKEKANKITESCYSEVLNYTSFVEDLLPEFINNPSWIQAVKTNHPSEWEALNDGPLACFHNYLTDFDFFALNDALEARQSLKLLSPQWMKMIRTYEWTQGLTPPHAIVPIITKEMKCQELDFVIKRTVALLSQMKFKTRSEKELEQVGTQFINQIMENGAHKRGQEDSHESKDD